MFACALRPHMLKQKCRDYKVYAGPGRFTRKLLVHELLLVKNSTIHIVASRKEKHVLHIVHVVCKVVLTRVGCQEKQIVWCAFQKHVKSSKKKLNCTAKYLLICHLKGDFSHVPRGANLFFTRVLEVRMSIVWSALKWCDDVQIR